MDAKFNSILSVALVPQVVDLIVQREGMDDISALNAFYLSKTYEVLAREETKVWHFSPLTIYSMWATEKKTGEIIFPED